MIRIGDTKYDILCTLQSFQKVVDYTYILRSNNASYLNTY